MPAHAPGETTSAPAPGPRSGRPVPTWLVPGRAWAGSPRPCWGRSAPPHVAAAGRAGVAFFLLPSPAPHAHCRLHTQSLLLDLPAAPVRVAAPLPTATNAWVAFDRPSPPLRGDDKVSNVARGIGRCLLCPLPLSPPLSLGVDVCPRRRAPPRQAAGAAPSRPPCLPGQGWRASGLVGQGQAGVGWAGAELLSLPNPPPLPRARARPRTRRSFRLSPSTPSTPLSCLLSNSPGRPLRVRAGRQPDVAL